MKVSTYPWTKSKIIHRVILMDKVGKSVVAKTTVAFQNGRQLSFNPIYFANELGDPDFFFFSLKHFF